MHFFLLAVLSVLPSVSNKLIASILVPPTAENCVLGKQWVIDFIKFECTQKNIRGAIVKMVRTIGCVPDNTQEGKVVLNGSVWQDGRFTYFCNRTREKGQSARMTFKPINCLDGEGKVLLPGNERKMKDGVTYKCYICDEGDVHLSIDGSIPGCQQGSNVYKERSTWLRTRPMEVEVSKGRNVQLGIGAAVLCEKKQKGQLEGKEYGCVTAENKRIDPGDYGVVSGHVVKCLADKKGQLYLELANEDLLACKVDGKRVVGGTEWFSKDGDEKLKCHFGKIIKIACIAKGKSVPLHELRYIDGVAYQCGEKIGEGILNFGTLKGCTLANGSLIEFFDEIESATKVELCRFRVDNGVVSAFLQQIYCVYRDEKIQPGETKAVDHDVVKCEWTGREYITKKLDEIEMEEWKAKQANALDAIANFEAISAEGMGQHIKKGEVTTPKPKNLKTCEDKLDDGVCKRLAPICQDKQTCIFEELSQLLTSAKVPKATIDKAKNLFAPHFTYLPVTNTSATADFIFKAQCANSAGCAACSTNKAALRNVVAAVCPKTCKQCDSGSSMDSLISGALAFHRQKCL